MNHRPAKMKVMIGDKEKTFPLSVDGINLAAEEACAYIRWKYGRSRGSERRVGERR